MKVMSIMGTRPEMIKMWSTLKRLDDTHFEHIMVHTGQNFTPELRQFFFDDLKLRKPDFELDINTSGYGVEVADVILKSEEVMKKVQPDCLLVLGDTYSGLSVLPASNLGIRIFHMEAGLRAWDKRMPEQRNRILIDHISDILLPYNDYHRENLIAEGIHPSKIIVTGNTTFEAMNFFQDGINSSDILAKLGLESREYMVISAHRSENVDNPLSLNKIFDSIKSLVEEWPSLDYIFPMHPRTKSKIKGVDIPKSLQVIEPLGFYDFNKLVKESCCVLSDSGTSAEEGLYYKVPNVNLRVATERMETLESGGTIVAGLEPQDVVSAVKIALNSKFEARYDFADGFSPASVVVNSIATKLTNYF